MMPWSKYIDIVQNVVSSVKEEFSNWVHEVPPEYVKNDTDQPLTFCVSMQDGSFKKITLSPGMSMTDFPQVKDIEAVYNENDVAVKILGKLGYFGREIEFLNDNLCKIKSRAEPGLNETCQIVDKDSFLNNHPEWGPCLEGVGEKECSIEPFCGYDFDIQGDDPSSSGSDASLVIKPVELPGGLFSVGLRSLTFLLHDANFEGIDDISWKHPEGFYNKLGHDSPGYYGNHFMECSKIKGDAPHGIYQNLTGFRIKGPIRFGVHAKRIGGDENTEIAIAIWSLNTGTNTSKIFTMPENVYVDCYTDADVTFEDVLRFEIYLTEGASFHLGGAYILQKIVPESGIKREDSRPPHEPGSPDRPGGDWEWLRNNSDFHFTRTDQ